MPCYSVKLPDGTRALIRGSLGPHCAYCAGVGDFLCDFPVGDGKTCDRPMCEEHAHEVGPDLDYCPAHFVEWRKFRDAGGVERELKNVRPFRAKNEAGDDA